MGYTGDKDLEDLVKDSFDFSSETHLLSESNAIFPSSKPTNSPRCNIKLSRLLHPILLLLHVILLSLSAALFLATLKSQNAKLQTCPGNWFPLMGNFPPIHTIRFNGTFNRDSPFKGPPSKTVDEAWDRILPLGAMHIPETTFTHLNASKHAVHVPPEAGGGRLALFEAIHLLHCVKTLWMTAYPAHYPPQTQSHSEEEEYYQHIDHCADMLRQKLMCDADANLITYNWIKGHYAPHPNFNVQHRCRDYGRLLEVAGEWKVDGGRFENGWILRPEGGEGEEVVEFEGEPPFDPE